MKHSTDIGIDEAVSLILEPNAAFLSTEGDEGSRGYIDPVVVQYLTFIVLQVAIPFILNVAASVFANNITKQTALNTPPLSEKQLDSLKQELDVLIRDSTKLNRPDPSAKQDAINAIEEILFSNGWPRKVAREDAEKIVGIMVMKMWGEEP